MEKPAVTVSEGEYTVQQKDNYYKIAKQFNLTREELFALNPGLEEKGLKPGEKILVKNQETEMHPVQMF